MYQSSRMFLLGTLTENVDGMPGCGEYPGCAAPLNSKPARRRRTFASCWQRSIWTTGAYYVTQRYSICVRHNFYFLAFGMCSTAAARIPWYTKYCVALLVI